MDSTGAPVASRRRASVEGTPSVDRIHDDRRAGGLVPPVLEPVDGTAAREAEERAAVVSTR